ncbi:hypothetical protein ScKU66_19200 [Streptococcus canis]|nr:hypothetical protein SpKU43_16790 [Streptococcus canis]
MMDNPCQQLNPKKLLKTKNSTVFTIEGIANSVDLTSFYSYKTIRTKLKIQCPHGRAGSTPAAGIA